METEHYLIALALFVGAVNFAGIYWLSKRTPKGGVTRIQYQDRGMAWTDEDGYVINSTTKPENLNN